MLRKIKMANVCWCTILIVISSFSATLSYDCSWYNDEYSTTFDLCDLELKNASTSQIYWYHVKDKRAVGNVSSFEYFFNVADNILRKLSFDDCYNITRRLHNNHEIGYCDNVFNYTCKGSIQPISNKRSVT